MTRKFALIIGNSEYDDASLSRLKTPDADVNALAEILRAPDIGGFDEAATLVNQPATTVRRAIARFFAVKQRDDLLLLYFSGHGVLDDRGHLFLAVKDTERDLLSGTAIPATFVTDEMDRSYSRRQVLILDCCHSGAFARGTKGAVGASVGTATAFEGVGSGRVVLTATDATQYAWEGDQVVGQAENSVFTYHLIGGLQTGAADADGDGRITLDELYDYVYGQVVTQTPRQIPGKWSYRQQGEMVIAHNPRPAAKPVELPAELRQAIESPFASVREGAVRELDRFLRGSHPELAQAAREALTRLADDDSRMVSTVAAGILAAYADAQRAEAREREEQARRTWEQAEAERLAHEKVKHEQLARERAEVERRRQAQLDAQRREKEEAEQARQARRGDVLGRAQAAIGESRWADALNLLNQLKTEAPEYEPQTVGSLRAQAQEAVRRERHLMELYQQAEEYARREKWARAAETFKQVLAIDPNYRDAARQLEYAQSQVHWVELYAQGMKHHRAKRWKEALETFQTLRGLAGDYKDIKTLMAVAEREQLAWQKAEADRLVKQKAKAEHAARKKAEQEERAQERTQAVASLAKRVRRVPSRGRVLLLLAILGGIAAIATLSSLPSPEQLRVLKHTAGVGSVTWSPDGTRLALVSSDDTVMVWDAASGEQLLVLRGHTHGVDSVAWSPDGTRLASGGCDGFEPPYCVAGAVRVWDAASGQQLLVLEGHTAGVGSVGWSPDGTRLASSGSEDDAIRVWNAASGEQLCELRSNRSFIGTVGTGSVAWSPDGTKLVSGEFQQAPAVRVWDAARCEELRVLPIRHGGSVLSLAWSPDGTRLASSSLDGTVVIWDAASDTVLRQLDDCGCWIYSVTWSPDSTQLAASHSHTNTTFETGDRTIRVWDAPSGEQLLVLRGHTGDVNSVAWSPDGALLASGSADGTVRIWDVSDIR